MKTTLVNHQWLIGKQIICMQNPNGLFFVILIQSRNFKWGSHLEQVKEQEQQQSLNAQLFGMSYMDHHWLIGCVTMTTQSQKAMVYIHRRKHKK